MGSSKLASGTVGWKDEITEERLLRGRQALGKVVSMGFEITMNLEE